MTAHGSRDYLLHGALPALVAAACFAGMAAMVKLAAAEAGSQMLVFLRAVFGLLMVLPFALARGAAFLRTTRTRIHLTRACASFGALSCFYFAVSQIGLGEAILLNASSPLFIGILAVFMLGEHLDRRSLVALVVGFCGVVLLLKPGTDLFQLGAMVGACSGLFVAFAKILIRRMADTEPVLRTVFYFSVYSTVLSGIPLLWLWRTPSVHVLGCMLLGAVFATLGQTTLTYAFSHNRAASVAPYSYVTVMLGGVVGWLFWQEMPDWWSLAGAGLVIAGCLSMLRQPRQPNPWRGSAAAEMPSGVRR